MRTDVISSVVDRSILKTIVEVKETVATFNDSQPRRVFTVAELWRIQKKANRVADMLRRRKL